MVEVQVNNLQSILEVDERHLASVVQSVLLAEGIENATISVAVVDGPMIHDLNRRHLQHDYPTDVLSFTLESTDSYLEGEIVVSGEMAFETSAEYRWNGADELLLYVIHGLLHLVGYDDKDTESIAQMRHRERIYLHRQGVQLPDADISPRPAIEQPEGESAA